MPGRVFWLLLVLAIWALGGVDASGRNHTDRGPPHVVFVTQIMHINQIRGLFPWRSFIRHGRLLTSLFRLISPPPPCFHSTVQRPFHCSVLTADWQSWKRQMNRLRVRVLRGQEFLCPAIARFQNAWRRWVRSRSGPLAWSRAGSGPLALWDCRLVFCI